MNLKSNLIFLISVLITSPVFAKVIFPIKLVHIGGAKVRVELASSAEQQEQGLMFRNHLDEGRGMLFIFPQEQPRTFWMKNTLIPLSIGFFNIQNKLIDIQDMEPAGAEIDSKIKTYTSTGPSSYALEVNKGWFARHKVKIGDELKTKK
jgi:uncharacterized membrane protein (UPF0127 family)